MERILIIAEAGVNHNGDIQTAKKLIDAAAAAGADAVKFQTFKTENLVCRNAQKAAYQMETTNAGESQFDMLKKLELTPPMHKELISHCKKKSIMFLSTPFDVDSLHYLIDTGLAVIKIPSGEITNYPLLREAAKSGRRIILSSGMSTIEEVREAVAVLKKNGSTDITVLGATGTRLDHVLGNIQMLYLPLEKGIRCELLDRHNRIRLIRNSHVIRKKEQYGTYFSLIPFTTDVYGVTLKGAKYPLEQYHFTVLGTGSLGVSNEIVKEQVEISMESGILILIESKD